VFVAFAGCGGCSSKKEYPPNLTFPSRADRLVLKLPERQPEKVNEPGKLDEELAALDALGGKTVEPGAISADARAALDQFLKDSFGTPAAPKIALADDPAAGAAADRLKLSNAHLAEGGKLYYRHCLQCHNLPGDGRGTAGLWVIPYPRDFRRGAFKFVSSGECGKPRRADLLRTLNEGLKGTAMPSFALLQEGERDLLAGYATYLSVRGQVEYESLAALAAGEPNDPGAKLKSILAEWEKAENAAPLPAAPDDGEPGGPAHQEAVRRGFKLFTAEMETTAKEKSCAACHGEFGRKPLLRYGVWGTVAKPADFTQPALKGGSRAEDVFARVRYGIAPVGMPAHPKLTDREVWDLVRFVRSVPFPRELPDDVRAAVYPNP
jgi:mono/diheme cytochrome c family protein